MIYFTIQGLGLLIQYLASIRKAIIAINNLEVWREICKSDIKEIFLGYPASWVPRKLKGRKIENPVQNVFLTRVESQAKKW